ncbi:DASH complex subunit Duo1-domain-containing protein [Lipomyces japonicus]|uniref:DASH complex subunit Duo1-domain-containing protein n=1 Tax=Lipomyces japonicus TaxID=56871 RepID=UPI0034CF1A29
MYLDKEALAESLAILNASFQPEQQASSSTSAATPRQLTASTFVSDENLASSGNAFGNARQERLEIELQQVRAVNATITNVLESITSAESNLDRVVSTTKNVDNLLNLWIQILSQAEHIQRLAFDPKWEGATKDEELHKARIVAIAEQHAQAKIEAERKAKEAVLLSQKRKEQEEAKRKKDALLQKRIYGNKLGTSRQATTSSRPASSSISSSTRSTTTTSSSSSSSLRSTTSTLKTSTSQATSQRPKSTLKSSTSNTSSRSSATNSRTRPPPPSG